MPCSHDGCPCCVRHSLFLWHWVLPRELPEDVAFIDEHANRTAWDGVLELAL